MYYTAASLKKEAVESCLVRGTRRGPPREKKMYPPLKLEMVMLICCFALLTGWAGLVHVWIVTAQGNGKVLVLGMDGLFTTHLLAVVACQATRRMTEDELPGPLAEGAGLS